MTSNLVGRAYKLGEMDCAGLILEVAGRAGMPLSKTWEGFTPHNYAEFYRRNPREAMEVLGCWVSSIGEEVPPHRAFAGDLMIAEMKRGGSGPAILIHAGQDLGMIVNEKRGVTLVPLRAYEIKKAFRWRKARKPKLKRIRAKEK